MRYFIKNRGLYVILVFIVSTLNAQNYPSININTIDGLPNNQVESIFKDSRGILWVGTNNGLSKIENNKITNFFVEDGLAHNSSWDIIEDTNHKIWIASYGGGITKYDGEKFTVFNVQSGLANNYVRKLFEYKNYVLVGTKNGLSFINSKNDAITTFDTSLILNKDSGLPDFQVMDFFVYKDEIYCVTFRLGVFKLNIEQKTINKIFNYVGRYFVFSTYLKQNLFYYSIDSHFRKGKGAVCKFNIENLLKDKDEDLRFGKSIIWEYVTDNHNNLFGAGWGVHVEDGGVFLIKDDVFINKNEDFGISSPNIKCLYFDKTFNLLYVGSQDNGYYKVDLNENIKFFKNKELAIIDIESNDSNLVLLNKKSLMLLKNDKLIKQVTAQNFLNYAKSFYSKNQPSPINEIFVTSKLDVVEEVVFYDIVKEKSSYWVSSYLGLFELDFDGNFLNYYSVRTNKFNFDFQGRFIYPIPFSDLNIVKNLNSSKGFVDNFQFIKHSSKEASTPVDVSAFVKSKDKIFISTLYKGLFIYNKDAIISLNETNNFKELELTHLAISNKSYRIAIATNSGEVYLADIRDDFKISIKISRESIKGNSILFLEMYKDYVIIGTENGLTIYNKDGFRYIDEEQGLKRTDFTSSKVIGNELIIGTNLGYYKLDLEKILNPPVVKFDFKIYNIRINRKPIKGDSYNWFDYSKSNLELNYDENVVELDYLVSNHPYSSKLEYRYQIKGLNEIWSTYSNKTHIELPYLPSGKFSINVQVRDLNSGKESSHHLLNIIISPPFWKTIWFVIVVFSTLLILSFISYKKRINYIKKREEKKSRIEKRLVETKLEALQSQMNPHFTFNAMNSIQNYIIDNDIDNALMYLGEFAKLIRKTLDNSSQRFITLVEEISYLKSYIALENMRFNNKVKVKVNCIDLNSNMLEIPPMLIQPFVENVFVHAFEKNHPNPKLTITFSLNENTLQCEISDNGKGMAKTTSGQMHQSKGLKLVTERLYLLNKSVVNKFKINSELGNGTIVILQIEILR
ncbi:Two component regulator propeller [Flavobacterium gillisiae]|uniref:Two component regulator propeller n=1 Tax=Flavobacterium gillisiae TaxID=150146 RepID=A0A1H4GF43_9FLAO|nr:histidine kinase [Flavobacterium gillisiae]SEB07322.1 Two component regulator propeller [Flavobacterium gillisiae]